MKEDVRRSLASGFEVLASSTAGSWDPGVPIAAARAGFVGVLDLTWLSDATVACDAVERLSRLARGRHGLILGGSGIAFEKKVLACLDRVDCVLLGADSASDLLARSLAARKVAPRVGLIATCEEEARQAVEAGLDFIVAKGNEAGGRVGEETTFVLLQRLLGRLELPIYAWGGVGAYSAAACRIAGAAGVMLDWQLSLTRESPIPSGFRRRIALMDGSETATVTGPDGKLLRMYARTGATGVDRDLETLSANPGSAELEDENSEARLESWNRRVERKISHPDPEHRLWLTDQSAAFASRSSGRPMSVARMITCLLEQVKQAARECIEAKALRPESDLARSHGTRFPVVQGPMTRVSDVPAFCDAVERGGGLPFLALAMMRRAEVRRLLEETRDRLGERPWGVGILGFVDLELRKEQLSAVEEIRPEFAIIAGGRPDQAASLEAQGIKTYLHVPSPGLLDVFVKEGARRFIFEGRECGGHVGPRSSFVLWDTMVHSLVAAELSPEEASKIHVLFAGGIHDGLSSSMVAALAQPLVARGMKIGVLLGTAYLTTEEIVTTGAIVQEYQDVTFGTDGTALLRTGPGHEIRCAETEYLGRFDAEKARLDRDSSSPEAAREKLEEMNLGRLRIATKGIQRAPDGVPTGPRHVKIDAATQRQEGVYMIGQIAALRKERITVRDLHESVSTGGTERLEALRRAMPVAAAPSAEVHPTRVAIVGISCFLPGALDVQTFWENILEKRDQVGEVPPERFDVGRWFSPDRDARDKIYGKWGGFIEDVAFDPVKYGIPPKSLGQIEPVQLLALELVHQVLEDAGYLGQNTDHTRTSVMLGVGGGVAELAAKYVVRAYLPRFIKNPDESLWSQLPEWTEDSFAGLLENVVAGRVSNRFDLGGTNFTVDAACASSLASIYLAYQELASGASDLVIAGGCDTVQSPFAYHCFSSSGALSPQGKSRTFDADADGIAISEGLAAVALKRLHDAERDGDQIHAVIRMVAGGSDGQSKGMTAPCVQGQTRTLERTYARAGFGPETVELFEAHGTGTALGDQTECKALSSLLKGAGAPEHAAAIGSVKSMIGHTKCTAGVAGLIKMALALKFRTLPPTLHVAAPNPKADLVDGPLYVNSELRPWVAGESPRRAAVSSFGFGGTNFHAVLEEYDARTPADRMATPHRNYPAELFVFTAPTVDALVRAVSGFAAEIRQVIDSGSELNLADLAHTLHRRPASRDASRRAALVSRSTTELLDQLETLECRLSSGVDTDERRTSGIYFCDGPLGESSPLAFVFPGQGSQYVDMLRDLAVEFFEVSECFERADRTLEELDDRLSRLVYPPPAFDDARRTINIEALKSTQVAQPALGVCDTAMMRLLAAFGVRPDMVSGHSYGELVALHAAGSLDEATLYRLSFERGESIMAMTRRGARRSDSTDLGQMCALRAAEDVVRDALQGCEDVWIANLNSPSQTIISGTRQGIEKAAARLRERGLQGTVLPVACAFHSPIMTAARDRFREVLEMIEFATPNVPVFSNTTATTYPDEPRLIRDILARQLVSEVRFAEQVHQMHGRGARVFVEVGPGKVLTGLVDQTLENLPHATIATDVRGSNGVVSFLHALGSLIAQGVAVDTERLYAGRELRRLDLRELATRDPQHDAHVWLVNGSSARPAHEAAGVPEPGATMAAGNRDASCSTPIAEESRAASPALPLHGIEDTTLAPVAEEPEDPPWSSPGSMDPYAQFQETMRQFLETEEAVMTAYFASDGQADRAVEAVPPEADQTEQPVPREVAEEPDPAATETRTSGGTDGDRRAERVDPDGSPGPREAAEESPLQASSGPAPLEDRLLDIVSERTGYPPDMLDLDANLEADLGIDSIKRVEIIATFRRSARPDVQEPPAWFMEEMTAARTMRAICQGMAKLGNGATKVDQAYEDPIPDTPAAPDQLESHDLKSHLTDIVSERTGYPPDMLDLDANLEADLGIDSIKRVEIIATFRRSARPDVQEPPAWFMEEMTAARTMRAICQGVAKLGNGAAKVDQTHEIPTPDTPAAPDQLESHDLESHLTDIVSERTGYPPDMLDLDANLEADLGIDSIKRVEIIATFRRSARPDVQEPPAWFMEEMTAARTMRAICQGMAKLGNGATKVDQAYEDPTPDTPTAPEVESRDLESHPTSIASAPRCVVRIVEVPRRADRAPSLPAGIIALTDDGRGSAHRLVDRISEAGGQGVVLDPGDLISREAATSAIERVRALHGPIGALVHLLPLREAPSFPEISLTDWNDHIDVEVKSLLFLMQALATELTGNRDGTTRVVAMSRGAGAFGLEPEAESRHPWRGGLSGLLKTAAIEWPEARFHSADVDAVNDDQLFEALLDAIADDAPVEVGYRNDRRLTVAPELRPLPQEDPEHAAITLGRHSIVLVTGGARGITARVAREIAARTSATMILLGRTAAPDGEEDPTTRSTSDPVELRRILVESLRRSGETATIKEIDARVGRLLGAREIHSTLKAIRDSGSAVEYIPCDVLDDEALSAVVRDVRGRLGPIDAVIHGAGLIEDQLIIDKTSESFDRVLRTKLNPLLTLARELDTEHLKLFMLFSSVAGFFGNRGQADYAAANEALNRLAHRLNDLWRAKIVAMNWGPWRGAGMVTAEVAKQFESRGVGLVELESGCRAAWQEFLHRGSDDPRVLIGPGAWTTVASRQSGPASGPSRLELPRVDPGDGLTEATTPLLGGQNVRRHPDGRIEARVTLTSKAYDFVDHHRIDGKRVLPLTAALELMAETAAVAEPRWHVTRVSDLRLLSGITVEGAGTEVNVHAEPLERGPDKGRWRVSITSPRPSAMPSRPGPNSRSFYQSIVHLSKRPPSPLPAEKIAGIRGAFPLSVAEAYDRWLFHGPRLRVIHEIQGLDDRSLQATVAHSPPGIGGGNGRREQNWLINPLVLDSGPQLAILWSRVRFDTTPLPNRVAEYHRYGSIPSGPLEVVFKVAPGTDRYTIQADVWFISGGQLVGKMEGLEGTGSANLNAFVGGQTE